MAGKRAAEVLKQKQYKNMRTATRMKATHVAVPDNAESSFMMASKANVSFSDK